MGLSVKERPQNTSGKSLQVRLHIHTKTHEFIALKFEICNQIIFQWNLRLQSYLRFCCQWLELKIEHGIEIYIKDLGL